MRPPWHRSAFTRRVSSDTKGDAFTLVELLIVVGIIVILIAVLIPSLEVAMTASKRSRCGTNLSAVGKALMAYVNDDSTNRYPQTPRYYMLMGQLGADAGYNAKDETPANMNNWLLNQDVPNRPLNKYLGVTGRGSEVEVAQCPSDIGGQFVLDPNNDRNFTGSANVFTSTGNSYVEVFGSFGSWGGPTHVRRTGIDFMFGTDPNQPSNARPADSKILVGDAPLHGENKYKDDPRNRWHDSDPTQRRFNILFADYHVEYFTFENNNAGVPVIETLPANTAGDPKRGFW